MVGGSSFEGQNDIGCHILTSNNSGENRLTKPIMEKSPFGIWLTRAKDLNLQGRFRLERTDFYYWHLYQQPLPG